MNSETSQVPSEPCGRDDLQTALGTSRRSISVTRGVLSPSRGCNPLRCRCRLHGIVARSLTSELAKKCLIWMVNGSSGCRIDWRLIRVPGGWQLPCPSPDPWCQSPPTRLRVRFRYNSLPRLHAGEESFPARADPCQAADQQRIKPACTIQIPALSGRKANRLKCEAIRLISSTPPMR